MLDNILFGPNNYRGITYQDDVLDKYWMDPILFRNDTGLTYEKGFQAGKLSGIKEAMETQLRYQGEVLEKFKSPDYNTLLLIRNRCAIDLSRAEAELEKYEAMQHVLKDLPKDVLLLMFVIIDDSKVLNNCASVCKKFYSVISDSFDKLYKLGQTFLKTCT